MSSFLGLDFSKNISYLAVPLAWVAAHAPHFYAVACAGKAYNNAKPRDFKERIANDPTLDDAAKRRFTRAQNASDNGYETLGFFAASVVAANAAGVDAATVNGLSFGYLAIRGLYNYLYIGLGDVMWTTWIRTGVWLSGISVSIRLFILASNRLSHGIPSFE